MAGCAAWGAGAWCRLHKLVYPMAVLGAVHFAMLVKGWQIEPLVYLAVIVSLIGLRLAPNRGIVSLTSRA